MTFITFNPFRTIGIPGVIYIKPEHMFREIETIRKADWILFPEYWQVPTLVYGLKKRIFPNIETIQLGYSKIDMTRALWAVCPEHVPYTEITGNTPERSIDILDAFDFPFVAKESRSSMGNGVFLINSKRDFIKYAEKNDVLYVQEYLQVDRDLRISVVGNKVIGAYWRIGGQDFHNNVAKGSLISFDNIPEAAIQLVKKVAKELNINHAGFDLMYVDGRFYFLEFNVLFGNQAFRQIGLSVEDEILEYLQIHQPPRSPVTPFPKIS